MSTSQMPFREQCAPAPRYGVLQQLMICVEKFSRGVKEGWWGGGVGVRKDKDGFVAACGSDESASSVKTDQ